jgi:hypothetical protein
MYGAVQGPHRPFSHLGFTILGASHKPSVLSSQSSGRTACGSSIMFGSSTSLHVQVTADARGREKCCATIFNLTRTDCHNTDVDQRRYADGKSYQSAGGDACGSGICLGSVSSQDGGLDTFGLGTCTRSSQSAGLESVGSIWQWR